MSAQRRTYQRGGDATPLDKGLPHNWETEKSLIGGLLVSPEHLPDVREIIGADDFHRPAHSALFGLMCELTDRGEKPDMLVVIDEVDRRTIAEKVGGIAYVVGLPQACPSVDLVADYAVRVKQYATRRQLLLAARQIEADIQEGVKDEPQLLADAEAAIFRLSATAGPQETQPIGDIADEAIRALKERAENPGAVTGLPTGFVDLDKILAGLQRTDLIVLAARPAMGKTAFVLNLLVNAVSGGDVAAGIFSLEMGRRQLVDRMICSVGRVNAGDYRTGQISTDDWRRACEAAEVVAGLSIEIDDAAGLTIHQLRSKARRMKAKAERQGRRFGLLVVDYLQLMQGSGAKGQNRENVISEISRGMKMIAKELEVPVIALSQLNRSLESRENKRPLPSDLRESGAIEQDADVIAFLYRDEVYHPETPDKGIAEVIIAKQRGGALGTVKLAFIDNQVRFENLAHPGQVGGHY